MLLNEIDKKLKNHVQFSDLKNYALNRWYNFWSAKTIENIFGEHKNIKPHLNSKDKLTDFYIKNIPFDHKTTIFPKVLKKLFLMQLNISEN